MADRVYKYKGSGDYYGDPVVIKGSWPQSIQDQWTMAMAKSYVLVDLSTAFVPVYESGTVSFIGNDGSPQLVTLNPLEFPDKATVDKLATMYGAIALAVPFIIGGGAFFSLAMRRMLQWNVPNKGIIIIDAYQFADYYTNNPPDIADKLCKDLMVLAGVQ